MQHQSETDFEKYIQQKLKHCSEENKQKAIQQLDELFELIVQIFNK